MYKKKKMYKKKENVQKKKKNVKKKKKESDNYLLKTEIVDRQVVDIKAGMYSVLSSSPDGFMPFQSQDLKITMKD